MDARSLREAVHSFFPADEILAAAREQQVQKRIRKLDVVALMVALVMTAGSDDSGRQADIYAAYKRESGKDVVRGTFYAWFTEALAAMLKALANRALATVWAQPPLLTGRLAKVGVIDWIVVDSETVTLPDELAALYTATWTPSGLKIHKCWSLGRYNLVDFEVTPARDQDAPVLRLDERWRGKGLFVDLGYVSLDLIRESLRLDILLVVRLKKGWKPWMLRTVDEEGELLDIAGEPVLTDLLEMATSNYDGSSFDFDVVYGQGSRRVSAWLVGVPGAKTYHWCITPELVQVLYRARWEIELDNKRDKGAARLDQIRAEPSASVTVMIYASLLRTMFANHLVYLDLRDRPPTRPPLHGMAVALTLNVCHGGFARALQVDDPVCWETLCDVIWGRGHDPNWRSRPSVLDQLRGIAAPPERPKCARRSDCPPSARRYRLSECPDMG